MFPSHGKTLATLRLLFLILVASGCGPAESYPNRPLTLICPWAVGGGTDRISRQLAFFLEAELGQTVNVINATGGGGVTGHRRGARAPADGYTLMMMTVEINMLHWRNITHLSWESFEPVALLNQDAAAVFVKTGSSRLPAWDSVVELTDYIREHPGELTGSGTAAGGIWHLAMAGWLSTAGLRPDDVRWIPMNGAGPSLQELASGGVDVVFCSLPEAQSFLGAGQVEALGVMSEERIPGYREVPTFREQGVDWVMGAWRGIGVPKGTPGKVIQKLAEGIERVLQGQVQMGSDTFPRVLESQGFNVTWGGPEEFRRLLIRNDAALGKLLTSQEFSTVRDSQLIGPMTFPLLILTGMVGALLALLLKNPRASAPDEGGSLRQWAAWPRFLEAVASVILYIFLAEMVGFVLAGGALLLALLWRWGTRPWVSLLIVVLLVPALYQLFANFLRVPLPRGWLGW